MKIKPKLNLILIFALCAAMLAFPVFAGDGDGSGGGNGEPLSLESSSIANGATEVSTSPSIVLSFSKNVVNSSVREANRQCFSLKDAAGNNVPISVVMGDDQVDPSVKRIITVTAAGLEPGTTYTLTISGSLTSKSGVPLGSPMSISFTTGGRAEAPPATEAPQATPTPEATPEPAPEATPEPAPEATPEPRATDEPAAPSENEDMPRETPAAETPAAETPAAVEEADRPRATVPPMVPAESVSEPSPAAPLDESSDEVPSSRFPTAVVIIVAAVLVAAAAALIILRKKSSSDNK